MQRNQAIRKLRSLKPFLDRYHVKSAAVFGSVARNEGRAGSDIDIMVEFSRSPGLLDFVKLQRELSEKFGRNVDLVTKRALHPRLKDRILGEAVYAFS
ncbi:MAG TPA: nucleotidyltransferase family protein [Rhizomicrobium sp.]|jgi:predicted nucleotidyltransferase|nr:nucleotidyltransferase family protein [Rhizomicrobium sp.]